MYDLQAVFVAILQRIPGCCARLLRIDVSMRWNENAAGCPASHHYAPIRANSRQRRDRKAWDHLDPSFMRSFADENAGAEAPAYLELVCVKTDRFAEPGCGAMSAASLCAVVLLGLVVTLAAYIARVYSEFG